MPNDMDESPSERRSELLRAIGEAGRENSTATVLFHTAISERAGLGPSDHKALDVLLRHGPMTAGQLREYTALTPASVTSLIDRLESQCLVRRTSDPEDRRKVIVEPVYERLKVLSRSFAPMRQSFDDLLSRYSEDQLETILSFLEGASNVLRSETERLRDLGALGA